MARFKYLTWAEYTVLANNNIGTFTGNPLWIRRKKDQPPILHMQAGVKTSRGIEYVFVEIPVADDYEEAPNVPSEPTASVN